MDLEPSPCKNRTNCLVCSYVLNHPIDWLLRIPMTAEVEEAMERLHGGPITSEIWQMYLSRNAPSISLLRYLDGKIDLSVLLIRFVVFYDKEKIEFLLDKYPNKKNRVFLILVKQWADSETDESSRRWMDRIRHCLER